MKPLRTLLLSGAAALLLTTAPAMVLAQQAADDHSAHHAAPAPQTEAAKPAAPTTQAPANDMSRMMADMAKMMEAMKSGQADSADKNKGRRSNQNSAGNRGGSDDLMGRMGQMMTMMSRILAVQQSQAAGSGHDTAAMQPKGNQGPSSQAFAAINRQMHAGMDISFTGNADADFVKGMIPHHEGAVDMAKVVLAFGKDAEIRKLAEAVVKAQEAEIAMMKDWLAKNAK